MEHSITTFWVDPASTLTSISSSHPQHAVLSADKLSIMTMQQAHSKTFLPTFSTSRTVSMDVIIIETDEITLALLDQPAT
jgi:hypothetical protein